MNQTSLEAYYGFTKPKLGTRQRQVFEVVEALQPVCNQQIAEYLGWPINMVTGRVKELRDAGNLTECYRRTYNRTGKRVNFWSTPAYKALWHPED